MAIQQFELLKKSAVTEIQADLEAAVLADRLLAESARDAAQLAQTAAETSETNAELAETNAETAETSAIAAKDLAVAAANAFPATNPQVSYNSRVLADLGTIKDLDRLTELYMNQLNLLPYTHFMWDGNAGYKVVDGKLTKAYSMDNAGNDGTTSAGTEPYAGGLIAPNESLKAKSLHNQKTIQLTNNVQLLSTSNWAISFAIKLNSIGLYINNLMGAVGDLSTIRLIPNLNVVTSIGANFGNVSVINNEEIGKTILMTIKNTANGGLSIYKNEKLIGSISDFSGILNINQILNAGDNASTASISGELPYILIIKDYSISAYEIQLQHELLRLQHPEIEGKDIGNQHWATSNYEGVVTANGTVIPEYKYTAANSPELVVNGGFDTDSDWNKGSGWSIAGGKLNLLNSNAFNIVYQGISSMIIGKKYKVTYTIDIISGGNIYVSFGGGSDGALRNSANTYTEIIEYKSGSYALQFVPQQDGINAVIDNVSVKEAGWDELTTPGWCFPNNDPALGAIYGKLYNWYAVNEIAKNPPSGWRVPSEADFVQLRDYLGGQAVAGKKLKVLYGNNTVGTNESGFTMLGTTSRSVDGTFSVDDANYNKLWLRTETSSTTAFHAITYSYWSELYIDPSLDKRGGCALRLLRNSPVGEDTKIISTGRFSTDISANPKVIAIPFGYEIETVVVNSTNNLPAISLFLKDYNLNDIGTLFAGKVITANQIKSLRPTSDLRVMQQDYYIHAYADGNTGDGMTIDVVLRKIQ